MGNPISISTAPINRLGGRPYYDLAATVEMMERLWREGVVDGFEFQNLAEWDRENPPRDDDGRGSRLAAWAASPKYTVDEVAARLRDTGFPVLSVHANRDVGILLCSEQEPDVAKGSRLIHESLSLARKVGAGVCVFHLWDTWKTDFDPVRLKCLFGEIADQYPNVSATVENMPTHLPGVTPFELAGQFEWITLDLRWAGMYDELDRFASLVDRVANVHLRGRLEGGRWVLSEAPFDFYEALDTIRDRWGYSGVLTMEASVPQGSRWEDLVVAMLSLRRH